jgi:tetratricopeptide (TPR) repeat protein
MKKNNTTIFILAITAFIFATMQLFAGNSADSLKQANDLYAKKQYEKALPIYVALNKSGYTSATLFYNTGCAYFKTNDFVRAILFFERAQLLDPNNDDIKFNLDVARTRQVDKLDIIPEFFLTNWVKYAAGISSSNAWSIYGLLLFVGALTLLFLFFFATSVSMKRTYFSLALSLVLFSFVSLWFSSIQIDRINIRTAAIVLNPSVTAKSSPDDAGTDLFLIHEGLKVSVVEKVAGWVKIKLSNGSVGWLKLSDIEVI